MPLAALFALITAAFGALAVWTASSGRWPLALAAAVLAAWMAGLAVSALRKRRL